MEKSETSYRHLTVKFIGVLNSVNYIRLKCLLGDDYTFLTRYWYNMGFLCTCILADWHLKNNFCLVFNCCTSLLETWLSVLLKTNKHSWNKQKEGQIYDLWRNDNAEIDKAAKFISSFVSNNLQTHKSLNHVKTTYLVQTWTTHIVRSPNTVFVLKTTIFDGEITALLYRYFSSVSCFPRIATRRFWQFHIQWIRLVAGMRRSNFRLHFLMRFARDVSEESLLYSVRAPIECGCALLWK